jgi:hypothetical protein
VKNAEVYITPGVIIGLDTFYNSANRIRLYAVDTIAKIIPALDSILGPFSGVYMNPVQLTGNSSTPYKLDISIGNGTTIITAKTFIPKVIPIDSFEYYIEPKNGSDSLGKSYVKFWFFDGPERNNYRLAVNVSPDSILYKGTTEAFHFFKSLTWFHNNLSSLIAFIPCKSVTLPVVAST